MADPALTPAGELRAAAGKLREMAAAASKGADGPWSTERYWWKTRSVAMPDQWMCAVTDEYGHVATSSEVDDDADGSSAADRVAWIALMGPDKAELLAVWLETEAHCLGVADGVGEKTADLLDAIAGEPLELSVTVVADTSIPALAFARSILGSS